MKRYVAAAILILFFPISVCGADPILVVTGEWAPYVSESLPGYGVTTRIVSAVFKEMNAAVHYEFLPWKRCASEVASGRAFAAFPYHVSEERQKSFDFSDAIGSSTWKFFYLKKSLQEEVVWEKLIDLKGYRIGCSLGNWYDKVFKEAGIITKSTYYAPNDELNFKKLWMGRVDLVPADERVGWTIIKQSFPQSINAFGTLKRPLKVGDLHMMISRTYPDAGKLKDSFNAALARIRQNGKLDVFIKDSPL